MNSGLPGDYVTSIAIDKDGYVWIGTLRKGLAVYKEQGSIPFLRVEVKNNFNTICFGEIISLGESVFISGGVNLINTTGLPILT